MGYETTDDAARKRSRHEGENGIPQEQDISLSFRGGGNNNTLHRRTRGKYFFHMDAGYFSFVDPHGFGVVERYERGLLGHIEISATIPKPTINAV